MVASKNKKMAWQMADLYPFQGTTEQLYCCEFQKGQGKSGQLREAGGTSTQLAYSRFPNWRIDPVTLLAMEFHTRKAEFYQSVATCTTHARFTLALSVMSKRINLIYISYICISLFLSGSFPPSPSP